MTIQGLFSSIGKAIMSGIKSIIKLIIEAKAENIVKAGLFIGTAAVTAVFLLKSMRNKHRAYSNDSNMSPVDRALALNYTDKRNRDKLDPILSEVKKVLGGGKKTNRKCRADGKKLRMAIKNLSQYNGNGYDPKVLNEMQKFQKDMEELETEGAGGEFYEDNFVLRRVWDRA